MADKRISQLIERTNIANNDVLPIVASGATTTNKVTISTIQDWMQDNLDVGVTSVGLSMPSAFVVSNSPVTASGNITVTGAGTVSQYIRGDGSLADFPQSSGGGGASVSYYLNGSVSQGTIGGIAYREMNKTPIFGTGTDITINANGYIASFITDAGDPALLEIPGGNWNFETYLSASSGGGSPTFYIELYKVNSGGTATLIASNSATPELIAFGTTINPYFSALAVPTTVLTLTDRLALRYYVTHAGRTITLHTEDNHLCQIITTFTTGLTALNGLTAQVQNFATGTTGTDFNIASAVATHTFNIPSASATARGLVTTGSQTIAGAKTFSDDAIINGVRVGRGSGTITSNTIVGEGALNANTTGNSNTAIGQASLPLNTTGSSNTAVGRGSLEKNTTAIWNCGVGTFSLFANTTGSSNIAIGNGAGGLIADGITENSITNNSVFLGGNTRALANNQTNQIVIGHNAIGNGSNTVTIGNDSITSTFLKGNISLKGENSAVKSIQYTNPSGTLHWSVQTSFGSAGEHQPFSIRNGVLGTDAILIQPSSNNISLTGSLNGTSAVFTGNVTSYDTLVSRTLTNTTPTLLLSRNNANNGFGVMRVLDGGTISFENGATGASQTSRLTLDGTTGTAIFTGALNGTSASFTGTVTMSGADNRINSGNELRFYRTDNAIYSRIYDAGSSFVLDNRNGNGFSFQSAGTNQFSIASTGAATFSSSVTSPVVKLSDSTLSGAGGFEFTSEAFFGARFQSNAYKFMAGNNSTEYMRITSTGNVGIGTPSPTTYSLAGRHLEVNDAGGGYAFIHNNTTTVKSFIASNESGLHAAFFTFSNHPLLLGTNNTERMRITSGGYLKASNTGTYINANLNYHELRTNLTDEWISRISSTAASPYGLNILYTNASPNGADNWFIYCQDDTNVRFRVASNGNVTNTNGSYGAISDIKLKENIEDASPKLDDLMKVKVRNYNLIGDEKKQIGVIAQELEEVFPAMIDESEDFEEVEVPQLDEEGNEVLNEEGEVVTTKEKVSKGTSTKSVKYSVFVPMLIKAMQEQQEQIKSLTEQVEALKSQING